MRFFDAALHSPTRKNTVRRLEFSFCGFRLKAQPSRSRCPISTLFAYIIGIVRRSARPRSMDPDTPLSRHRDQSTARLFASATITRATTQNPARPLLPGHIRNALPLVLH